MGKPAKEITCTLRVRLGLGDTHYPDGLVPAATILRLFADCASEVGIRRDGVDGFLAAWEKAEFLKPVRAGDWIEITGRLVDEGNRSRRIALEARRPVEGRELGGGLTGGVLHDPPELVGSAIMVGVKPRDPAA